jgi:hypothetical protein
MRILPSFQANMGRISHMQHQDRASLQGKETIDAHSIVNERELGRVCRGSPT